MENYLFGSARVSVLENGLIRKDQLERLWNAPSVERCAELLADYGIPVVRNPGTGSFEREETLLSVLRNAFREVAETTENAAFARAFRWQYDCNNIKAAIKCVKRGVNPDGMLFDFGNIEAAIVKDAAARNDFEALGEPFSHAAAEAVETFARTGNPQWVDLILDRACYAAMLRDAKQSKNLFVTDLVTKKIDLTNLLICIRLMRMKSGEAGRLLLADAFLPGGMLPDEFFAQAYSEGEEELWRMVSASEYREFASLSGGSDGSLTAVERAADDFWMTQVRQAKLIPYGVERLTAYLIAVETEVRNLRIILAGLEAGLTAGTIGERVRMGYV